MRIRSNGRDPTYSDEEIEHWGRVFEEFGLRDHNILFFAFLQAPREILHRTLQKTLGPEGEDCARALAEAEAQREFIPAPESDALLDAAGFLPLLPRQRTVQRAIDADTVREIERRSIAPLRKNGVHNTGRGFFERLRHHTYPR